MAATKKPAAPKKKMGRPKAEKPMFDSHKDAIVEWVSKGKTIRDYCRQEGAPCFWTVYKMRNEDESFHTRLAHARIIGSNAIAEECLDIADNATNDWMEQLNEDEIPVGYKLNGEHVQRSKLRIETRLKLLACWNRSEYGSKPEGDGQVKDIAVINEFPHERG